MERDALIGQNLDTGKYVFLTDQQRSTHMQVIGSTGTGKSKFLEHLIREDILAEKGLCLIDPHGYLYNSILQWLEEIGWPENNIILFDPSDQEFVTGFNPLKISLKDLSFHVDAMVRACAKVWGGEDTDRTPLLKRCLRIIFHALVERGLTLLEAQYLTSPTNLIAREYLTKDIQDPIIKEQWDYFNNPKVTPKLFYDEMGSTINRLMEFLAAERLRNVLGQKEQTIDFRKIMDEGYVLLVNLSSGRSVSNDNARLLGTLIVNDCFLAATERPPNSRPFYLYIDECSRYLNEDVGRILDEGRKFGLHLILAHQHLAQLRKAGEDIYYSILTDAKTKVVFGGLTPDDAKVLAELMFLAELDLDEFKHSLDRPTIVGYTKIWLRNWSEGYSFTNTKSSSQGSSSADTQSVSISYNLLSMGELGPESLTTSTTHSFSSSFSAGTSDSSSFQEGQAESLMPELQDRPTTTYSLEEQIHKAVVTLVDQQTRSAIVKLPGFFTKRIEVPFVQDFSTTEQAGEQAVNNFKNQCNQISGYNKRLEDAKQEIESRRQGLVQAMIEYEKEKARLDEPSSFKERIPPKRIKRPEPAKATNSIKDEIRQIRQEE